MTVILLYALFLACVFQADSFKLNTGLSTLLNRIVFLQTVLLLYERIVKSSRERQTKDATNSKIPTVVIHHTTDIQPHTHNPTTTHTWIRAHTPSNTYTDVK